MAGPVTTQFRGCQGPAHDPGDPRRRHPDDMLDRISWSAVLAGVVIALVTQLILSMIGLGIGVATLDPGAGTAENPTAKSLSIGAGIGWSVGCGRRVCGRLCGRPARRQAKGIDRGMARLARPGRLQRS